MKRHLRFCLLLILSLPLSLVNAQLGFNSPTPSERQVNREAREKYWEGNRTAGIESMTIECQDYKNGQPIGDFQVSIAYLYNRKGQDVKNTFFNSKGKLSQINLFEMDEEGNRTANTTTDKKGNPISREEYEYTDGKMTVMRCYFNRKKDPAYRREYGYDEGDKLIEAYLIRTRNNKLTQTWKFSYYEDGTKKRTEKLNRKNKLISATDYSCDKAGTGIAPAKADQQVVCKRIELDENGKQITVVETFFGEKNKERSISKSDSLGHMFELTIYDAAGVVSFQYLTEYNEAGQVLSTERYGRGRRFEHSSVYERNEKGKVVSETRYNEKEEVVEKLRYSYTYFN